MSKVTGLVDAAVLAAEQAARQAVQVVIAARGAEKKARETWIATIALATRVQEEENARLRATIAATEKKTHGG